MPGFRLQRRGELLVLAAEGQGPDPTGGPPSSRPASARRGACQHGGAYPPAPRVSSACWNARCRWVKNVCAHLWVVAKDMAILQMCKKSPADEVQRQAALLAFSAFPELKHVVLAGAAKAAFRGSTAETYELARFVARIGRYRLVCEAAEPSGGAERQIAAGYLRNSALKRPGPVLGLKDRCGDPLTLPLWGRGPAPARGWVLAGRNSPFCWRLGFTLVLPVPPHFFGLAQRNGVEPQRKTLFGWWRPREVSVTHPPLPLAWEVPLGR